MVSERPISPFGPFLSYYIKRVVRIGGGLVAISPGSPEIADQSSGIYGPIFLDLIAANDGHFRGHFPA